jgi:hypothetical protein
VIGIHVRAGNGETGDFASRGRPIENETEWLQNISDRILNQEWGPSLLFVATDTPAIVDKLRYFLDGHMPVVALDQLRPDSGSGVLFGERGKVTIKGAACLSGWKSAFVDMMLLSYADVVVAARPSSFSMSLPMSLALAKLVPERQHQRPFCEVNPSATEIKCFRDFKEWCCKGTTKFILDGIQSYDYLRMPPEHFPNLKIKERNAQYCIPRPEGKKQVCLPYDWSDQVIGSRSVRRAKSN